MALLYKRCLLKISGQSLSGEKNELFDLKSIKEIARQIVRLAKEGLEIAIVIGGGNIWRGSSAETIEMNKVNADYMGMLGTVMNALVLESTIKKLGYKKVIICSSIPMNMIAEPYYYKKVISRLESKHIIILAAGTGYPYFTTDTAATLRAIEIEADVILMAKNGVDGIYTKDPKTFKDAIKLKEVSLSELIDLRLNVMDQTASTLALNGNQDIIVFNINEPENIYKVAHGNAKYTKVKGI